MMNEFESNENNYIIIDYEYLLPLINLLKIQIHGSILTD